MSVFSEEVEVGMHVMYNEDPDILWFGVVTYVGPGAPCFHIHWFPETNPDYDVEYRGAMDIAVPIVLTFAGPKILGYA